MISHPTWIYLLLLTRIYAVHLPFVAAPTTSADASLMITVTQVKYVIAITSATALAWDTIKIVRQTMEMTSMPDVLLICAVIQTTSVDVQTTVTVHQVKRAT